MFFSCSLFRKMANNKIFIVSTFLTCVFCVLLLFPSQSYALTGTSYVYGNFTVYYQICRYTYSSNLGYDYLLCGGNYETTVSTSPMIDDGLQYFKLSMLDAGSNAQ